MFIAITPDIRAQKMFDLPKKMFVRPTFRESVDGAVFGENLKAVASNTTDPEVLLGLAFLAQTGDTIRPEISKTASEARPDYAPIVAVVAITMEGIDEQSIGELIRRDPDNALGYYLRGTLLHQCDEEEEAQVAFRKAGHCSELRLYESTTGPALFKAMDRLNLKSHDRLCALSWMASRSCEFSSSGLQPICRALSELAQAAELARRQEISDLLLVLAGHLYATNFQNRWFAQRALESALLLKAKLASNNHPMMHGYAAAAISLFSAACKWPGFDEERKPEEVARFLPYYIHQALAVERNFWPYDMNPDLPHSEKAAFDNARETVLGAAKALIDAAVTDPDGIVGAYLKGLPAGRDDDGPWALQRTFVGKAMEQRPDVFRAAAAFKEAMMALWKAGENDPERRNTARMMEIGSKILRYAQAHDNVYPDSIDTLFEKGCLKAPLEPRSLLTGRPYIYLAAGEKAPTKCSDASRFVLLYDDNAVHGRYYPCVTAVGGGSAIAVDELKDQLRKRGKRDT